MRTIGRNLQMTTSVFSAVVNNERVMFATMKQELPTDIKKLFDENNIEVNIEKVEGGFAIEKTNRR